MELFEYGPEVQQEMLFKDISYLELLWPFRSARPDHLCEFSKGHYEELSSEIILNLDQWFRREIH